MPNFRPLAIALGISLATLVPTHDAFAAKKKAARAPASVRSAAISTTPPTRAG